jgi:hypothetical protein
MNNLWLAKPSQLIPLTALVSLLILPLPLLGEDIRHHAKPSQLPAEAESRLGAIRGAGDGQMALRADSSGHEQRFTHNPLADDFQFFEEPGAPERTIKSNRYQQSTTSTQTRGADGGFPEWMPGGTYPWFIGSYSAPSSARPPGLTSIEPQCDYLGRSDPWVVPGRAIRHLGCEVRNMNTGARSAHHYDHCQIDEMAHNDRPAFSKSFMPATTGILGWSPRSNRSLCPAPIWSLGAFSGGSWSGSSSGCGGTFTQTKIETRTATCMTNGASPDSYCTQNGRAKPATSQTLTRTVNEPSCPSWTVGNWGSWQGSSECGVGQYNQTRTRSVTCPTGNCSGPKPLSTETKSVDRVACAPDVDDEVGNPICSPNKLLSSHTVNMGCRGYRQSSAAGAQGITYPVRDEDPWGNLTWTYETVGESPYFFVHREFTWYGNSERQVRVEVRCSADGSRKVGSTTVSNIPRSYNCRGGGGG